MSYSSICQYLTENESEMTDWDDLLSLILVKLNEIECMIQSHKDVCRPLHSFYTLKSAVVYFLYTICTPIDADKYMNEMKYTVKPSKIYKDSKNPDSPIYELTFYINKTEFTITVKENKSVSYGYLQEFFKDVEPSGETNETWRKDFSKLPDRVVYENYKVWFLDWCMIHNFFFMMFYDSYAVEYLLRKHILHGSEYSVHMDPFSPSCRMSFRRPKIYAYRYDSEKDDIMCAVTELTKICDLWKSDEIEWRAVWEVAAEIKKKHRGVRMYRIMGEDKFDFPMCLDMCNAVGRVLEGRYKRLGNPKVIDKIIIKRNGK